MKTLKLNEVDLGQDNLPAGTIVEVGTMDDELHEGELMGCTSVLGKQCLVLMADAIDKNGKTIDDKTNYTLVNVDHVTYVTWDQ